MKIFLLRHAAYSGNDADPVLSESGKRQASGMASKIIRIVGSESVTIWSSSANRAKETADIIAERLGVGSVEVYPELWSDNDHPYNFEWLREKIKGYKNEHPPKGPLVIISHLEYVRSCFQSNEANYGEGIIMDDEITREFR